MSEPPPAVEASSESAEATSTDDEATSAPPRPIAPPAAKRWKSTLSGIIEVPLRVSFARAELYKGDAAEVARTLNAVAQEAELALAQSRDVMRAFMPLLVDMDHMPRLTMLRQAALDEQLPGVKRLLRATHPAGHCVHSPLDPAVSPPPTSDDGREMTLGERRALARQPSRRSIKKLLRDPHPMVARILLANPRVTEEDVVGMAARRPAYPDLIREIGRSWWLRREVRLTVVQNPESPPAVSVPLLALVDRPDLARIARATNLPKVVRATAKEHWELRPPMSRAHDPRQPHH